MFAGIAEFERALIAERTRTGRRAAQDKGVRFGRPPALSAEPVALGQRLRAEGASVREAARVLRGHPATLYRATGARSPVAVGNAESINI